MSNYESYADVLESYMIAEEGILTGIKKAGGFIFKKLMGIIKELIKKVKELIGRFKKSGNKMSKKELIERLKRAEADRNENADDANYWRQQSDDYKEKYEKQYSNIEIINTNIFHDRFIIIDNKILYHSGASFKDLGSKTLLT